MLQSKQEVRATIERQRRDLSPGDAKICSEGAVRRFLEFFDRSCFPASPLQVGLYRALGNEVDLSSLVSPLLDQFCELYWPQVKGQSMQFIPMPACPDLKTSWRPGALGIEEPVQSKIHNRIVDLDLVFLPAIALSVAGNRIGRGGGYYDRYLQQNPKVWRVALVYDFQILQDFQADSWDIPVHWIVSEKRVIQLKEVSLT